MNGRPTTVERAYQLAKSGDCANVKELKGRLKSEGYADVASQLYGSVITSDLRRLCNTARKEPEASVQGA